MQNVWGREDFLKVPTKCSNVTLNHFRFVISTEGGVFCRRSGETCMLQSAVQIFVARFASRPAGCWYRHYRLHKQTAGLSTAHDDKTIMLRSR
jgi:hypothetical protein